MDTQISPEFDTSLKRSIEAVFLVICSDVAFLRAYFTTNAPGAVYQRFRDFKEHFDLLYTMSCNKKELNNDIVKRVKEWLNKKTTEREDVVMTGISLFDEYKTELFLNNVLEVG